MVLLKYLITVAPVFWNMTLCHEVIGSKNFEVLSR